MTKRAEFSDSRQAAILEGLWLRSGRDQTSAAAAGPMSHSTFWRLIKGQAPLREDQYPSMARALGITVRKLRLAMAGDDEEQAPVGWNLRAELEAALPGNPALVERAYRHWAAEPYAEQKDAVEAYRVLGMTEDAPPEYPYSPDDNLQPPLQRTAE